MENNTIDFEALSCEEKFDYLNEMLKRIKPECFKDEESTKVKPLGDFWVNLKDAKGYNWSKYSYEDFVIGLWSFDPNKANHSGSACDRNVGFPRNFKGIPNETSHWDFGDGKEVPDWFTQSNINEGNIWVKPLFVHHKED